MAQDRSKMTQDRPKMTQDKPENVDVALVFPVFGGPRSPRRENARWEPESSVQKSQLFQKSDFRGG